jgi:hypothetical protein
MRASDGGSSPRSRRLEHAAKQAPATSKHFNTRPPQASATTTEQAAGPCPPKARFLAGRAHHATNVTHLAHYPADSASRLHIVCSHRRLHLAGFTSPASPHRCHHHPHSIPPSRQVVVAGRAACAHVAGCRQDASGPLGSEGKAATPGGEGRCCVLFRKAISVYYLTFVHM